jgi:hypothetical protein
VPFYKTNPTPYELNTNGRNINDDPLDPDRPHPGSAQDGSIADHHALNTPTGSNTSASSQAQ